MLLPLYLTADWQPLNLGKLEKLSWQNTILLWICVFTIESTRLSRIDHEQMSWRHLWLPQSTQGQLACNKQCVLNQLQGSDSSTSLTMFDLERVIGPFGRDRLIDYHSTNLVPRSHTVHSSISSTQYEIWAVFEPLADAGTNHKVTSSHFDEKSIWSCKIKSTIPINWFSSFNHSK